MIWAEKSYSGWGRVRRADGRLARPEKAAALPAIMAEADGTLAVIGGLRSYGDAALNAAGPGLVMTRLDRILAFDGETGLVDVEAGITIRTLVDVFAARGWMPAVVPGTGHATIGGAIANDVHGKNHHQAGSFGQYVDVLELLGPDGTARLVTPDTDPALFRATIGGVGLTGAIRAARLRLAPCPSTVMEVEERRMPDLDAFVEAFEASHHPFTVGWVDATARGADLGRGILEEADFASTPGKAKPAGRGPKIPVDAPGFLLSGPIVRLFNRAYYTRIPAAGRVRQRHLTRFLFPLDGLRDWNRLYGKRGFHQFQCVLPREATDSLGGLLEAVADAGLASPLAVLKKLGPGRAGMLSFPMEGWTLAVDFPNRARAAPLIARLEEMTLSAGGRIYLAKDALARPDAVAAMYPELPAFRAVLAECDPQARFQTDLARRLDLRGS
ncbi:MAG: FAD-binding oxidoreductase [Pseudomonadota bacterium]